MRVCGVATLYPHIVFVWFRLGKYLLRTNTTHRETVVTVDVVAAAITGVEGEVIAEIDIIRRNGRRPNTAVRASVVKRAITIEVTSSRYKYLLRCICLRCK